MTDCVTLLSGGLDSVTLLHYLVKERNLQPAVITFLYGQKHNKEVELAQTQARLLGCNEHLILDLAQLRPLFTTSALVAPNIAIPTIEAVMGDPQPATYVPNRNMIFLALAAAYAESHSAGTVYYGAQSHDMYGYWDTTPEFLAQLNQLYHLNRHTPIHIEAPFIHHSKTDILRQGLALGVDYSLTWSCYQGQTAACGQCPTCAERLQAFANLDIEDPLPYQIRLGTGN
jgi:7-cyano-7-deazaguanine synthase